ncbi:MAG: hypothetical protein E4H36_09910 [Spirochaetales bacterium]|nr:MAG: hypothetical protein E4H36_09910 [Spirochaetales bacterium]
MKRTAASIKNDDSLKAWVVTVDMGLGHQRASYPFASIAEEGILTVGSSRASDPAEKKLWDRVRSSYEFISRVRSVPIIGKPLFGILDTLQNIPPFYPIRDMSNPTFQVNLVASAVKKGLGRGMLEKIKTKPLPLLVSYPVPAIAADMAGYKRIYAIVTDAEINRAWVAENPKKSKIHYLAPCGRALMRLRSYGVPNERISLTGFPFPLEVLGNEDLDILRDDMGQRLHYLDPNNRFWPLHERNVSFFLGRKNCAFKQKRCLTITFAVGGAGAQKEIGHAIVKNFRESIKKHKIAVNLIAGVRSEVRDYFVSVKKDLLPNNDGVRVVYGETKDEYFGQFSDVIRNTDILWTKPSELSFYCGLGIPVIMAPTIGSQEEFNRKWLMEIQAGIPQEDPDYVDEWLMDYLREGRLAEAAWDGFLKARKYGTYKILEVLETGTMGVEKSPLKR